MQRMIWLGTSRCWWVFQLADQWSTLSAVGLWSSVAPTPAGQLSGQWSSVWKTWTQYCLCGTMHGQERNSNNWNGDKETNNFFHLILCDNYINNNRIFVEAVYHNLAYPRAQRSKRHNFSTRTDSLSCHFHCHFHCWFHPPYWFYGQCWNNN